jgi:hypothetical protein
MKDKTLMLDINDNQNQWIKKGLKKGKQRWLHKLCNRITIDKKNH